MACGDKNIKVKSVLGGSRSDKEYCYSLWIDNQSTEVTLPYFNQVSLTK